LGASCLGDDSMRKIIMSGLFAIAVVGLAYAADHDRHADFSNPKTPTAPAGCKGFYGTDDNLTPCNDFCGQYRTDNEGATCECGDGKCPADDHTP
jgi:hypothetical protein